MDIHLDKELLDVLFSGVTSEMQVLDPVRNDKGEIIDFVYREGSQFAYGGNDNLTGKLLLTVYPWKKQTGLFDKLVEVTETGKRLDTIFQLEEDDRKQWFQIKARKYKNGLIIFREDLTTIKQTEEKIMQLNQALFTKNRELEALSSELKTFNTIAAHDYNDTLRALYKNMEFIVKNDAKTLSDAGKANIRRAQASIQKMKLLTDDIIEFSKVHSEREMVQVDLNEVLSMVLHGLSEKIAVENARINLQELPSIQGYPALLSLLFHHLVSNSIKFRKEDVDPVIDIKYRVDNGEEIEHSAAIRELSYHRISVIDNGIGFDPEHGEKIFTMFYRIQEKGKHKGSGIGLAICKKVMDLHGGFIAAECTPECTTFRCYFPIQK